MKITLEGGPLSTYILKAENDQTLLIQQDWDLPGVATCFSWSACDCGETDGTVNCSPKTASSTIAEVQIFLDGNIHKVVDDPAYF